MVREMHWSRWGDPAAATPLSESAHGLVDLFLGTHETPAVAPEDVRLGEPAPEVTVVALAQIVGSEHVLTDHATRLSRTRGKSTLDLLAIRGGDGSDSPDVVVRPADEAEVRAVLDWAVRTHTAVVPFGGGTSVVGGLAARREGYAGVISLDLARLDRLVHVDAESMTATLQAGLRGPEAEALLAEHGLTLGHFPQSFEHASIGGFAATRSSGQSSAGYGRFDSLVVGLEAQTPAGRLRLGAAPASAAGPDLRQWVLGSEGAYGVITSVTVRVRPRPTVRRYETWRWESFAAGATAMRTLAQAGLLPTVLRLSDEAETAINLATPDKVGGPSSGGCLMVVGHEGTDADAVTARREAIAAVLAGLGGTCEGADEGWEQGRFHGPYLRDSLLDVGVLVETLETATWWSDVTRLHAEVGDALRSALGEPAIVLCHISHVYETGASLYFTVAAPQGDDPAARWRTAKAAASDAFGSATITHHHAVGRDHRPWLEREIGPVGVRMLRAVKDALDPTGVLNPGVLIPDQSPDHTR
ncbi:FAD-binding oxidoreductase [Alteromonas gracilis]